MTPNQPFSRSGLHNLHKQADEREMLRRAEAIKAVLGATTLGIGGGAAARGLLGLGHVLFPKPPLMELRSPLLPRQIRIPVIRQEHQDEADRQRLGLEPGTDLYDAAVQARTAPRLSIGEQVEPPRLLPRPMKYAEARPLERIAESLTKTAVGGDTDAGPGLWDQAKDAIGKATGAVGDTFNAGIAKLAPHAPPTLGASNPAASALYMPLAVGGGAAGLYGGWKLVDWILQKRRQAEVARQLVKAKQDYRQALNEQYAADFATPKYAALHEISAELEKQGGFDWHKWVPKINWHKFYGVQPTKDVGNTGLGAYLTLAGLVGTGGFAGGWGWTRARSRNAALEEALRQRRLDRAKRPAPVFATAEEVPPEEFEDK